MMAGTMIVNRLSRLLGERRMSVMELKRQTGLSYGTVYNLYAGKSNRIDFETLDKLCSALDVQAGDILEYVPDLGTE
jgi:putative transcriptional regulator